eukprot:scaffold20489_cov107-Isochrysis_galbana.AAC.3
MREMRERRRRSAIVAFAPLPPAARARVRAAPARTTPNNAHLSTATPEACLPTRHSPTLVRLARCREGEKVGA